MNKKESDSRNPEEQKPSVDDPIEGLVHQIEDQDPQLLKDVPNKSKLIEIVLAKAAGAPVMAVSRSIEERHEGPLPPPRTLEEYDRILPGGAERIFSVFEQQAGHRMKMETTYVNGDQSLNKRGQHYALITALIFMGAGVFLVMNDHDTAGIALMSIDIVALAVAFITGKVMGAKDKEE